MGRSSKAESLENRTRIVLEASREFRRRGVENVSVSEIMAAAGMTAGGFYRHFPSKDALVAEACELSFERARQRWERISPHYEQDRQLGIVDYYFGQRAGGPRCPIIAFAPELMTAEHAHRQRPDSEHDTATAYAEGSQELLEVFAGATATEAAEIDDDTAVLFAAMVGASLIRQAGGDSPWTQRLQEAVRRKVAAARG